MLTNILLIVWLVSVRQSMCSTSEVRECPRFDYEYKLLERILILEHKDTDFERKINVLERKNEELADALKQQRLEYEEKDVKQDTEMGQIKDDLSKQKIDLIKVIEKQKAENLQKNKEQDIARDQSKTDLLKVLEQQKFELNRADEAQDRAKAAMMVELEASLKRMIAESNANQSMALQTVDTKVDKLEQDIATKITHMHPSFTAEIGSTIGKNGNTLIFDSVLTNDDNMYNSATGIFQVKTAGKYLISVTLSTANNKNFDGYLKRDSQVLARLEPDNQGKDNSGDNDTASVTIVVNLDVGDNVYVHCGSSATYLRGDHYNVFTGILLSS